MSALIAGSPEWLAERRTGIGASDAAASIGLAPPSWGLTPYTLWREKRGEHVDRNTENNESLYWGSVHEPAILRWYAEKTGHDVITGGGLLRSFGCPFMIAHLDGDVPDKNTIVEAKTVDKDAYRFDDAWGKPGTSEVPDYYNIQCQHGMYVAGRLHADLAALVGGNDPVLYHIDRDDDLIDDLIRGEAAFWQHVVDGTIPPVTSLDEAKSRYPKSVALKHVFATPEVIFAAQQLAAVKASAKQFGGALEEHELTIKTFMGDAADLIDEVTGDTIATWRSPATDKTEFDEAAFQEAHPDLYAEFVRSKPGARRFLLKVKAAE